MSNFDRAVKALNDVDEAIDHLADHEAYVTALEAAGLLAPDVQVIRTVEELEALDPDSWLMQADEEAIPMVVDDWVHDYNFDSDGIFPLVVMMDGAQVRAARKALEQEHG